MPRILLDTHAAVWSVAGHLPSRTAASIEAAASVGELFLSPISAWEIGMLVEKGRLRLTIPVDMFVRELFAARGVVTAAFTPSVALAAARLAGGLHGDPADRMLVATAIAYDAVFLTRDRRIREFARTTRTFRCAAC